MFDVGFSELFLLTLIGLLVLGPERLPGVARTIGGFIRKARASWNTLRQTIESELNEAEIMDPIKRAGEEFRRAGDGLSEVAGTRRETPASQAGEEKRSGPRAEEAADEDPPRQEQGGVMHDD